MTYDPSADLIDLALREDLAMRPAAAYVWQGVEGADATSKFGKVKTVRAYKSGEAMTLAPGETLVVDFGQNAAAEPRFTASAAAKCAIWSAWAFTTAGRAVARAT